jgi:hypothetical protein
LSQIEEKISRKLLNMNNKKVDDSFAILDDQFLSSDIDRNYITSSKVSVYLEQLRKEWIKMKKAKKMLVGGLK